MTPYQALLQDPRWQKLRLLKLDSQDWACEECGSKTETLHVHHPKYIKGRKPWEYGLDELEVLCKNCHTQHHAVEKALAQVFAHDAQWRGFLIGLVGGFLEAIYDLEDSRPCGLYVIQLQGDYQSHPRKSL